MIVVIGGPTAAGKSALALRIALALGGELVCADSRQIYAGLPIASAGPSDDECARVPHHGYGMVDPLVDKMTAGRFAAFADGAVADIEARGRVAVVVGGTGLYLRAWRIGLDAPGSETPKDMDALLARPARFDARWLLVDAPLDALEPRIRARAEAMFAAGIVDEAKALQARLPPGHPLLATLGTAEALDVAAGVLDVAQAVARTALRTRQYARRQRTWFKKEPWWTRLAPGGDPLPLLRPRG